MLSSCVSVGDTDPEPGALVDLSSETGMVTGVPGLVERAVFVATPESVGVELSPSETVPLSGGVVEARSDGNVGRSVVNLGVDEDVGTGVSVPQKMMVDVEKKVDVKVDSLTMSVEELGARMLSPS